MKRIGERIREEREIQGITRADLAAFAGIAKTTLSDLEAGASKSSSALHKIAERLGVSPRWLETGQGAKHRVSEPQSQYARLDFERVGAAVQVLREYLELMDETASWVADPVMLSVAYAVVVEFDEPAAPSNLLDMTKRLAERIRNAARSANEQSGETAGAKSKRTA